ncbi:hypothetical protein [Aureimonas jatrophae]|uniref:Phosphoglycerol transferase MdoB n=1 Tax=Aureimonas jatrophae TaxID=1166073 RepID=A0A1H0FFW6_9HYPH|nr:hypothetical protein [Aureimonas jatrophae]MBB3950030.1 hypothetical protein [Aureimonas jatrophae]SDN93678.1 Phosphoglycerol transferase MdoB [Aureimonas jatrophae]
MKREARAETAMPFASGVEHRTSAGALVRALIGLAILLAALALPERPGIVEWGRVPVEWFWAAGLLALLRGRAFALFAALLLALAAAVAVLKLADWGTLLAFSRPFDPVTDGLIVAAGWQLLSGTLGPTAAALAVGGALLAFLLALAFAAWGLTGLRRLGRRTRASLGFGGIGLGVAASALLLAAPAGATRWPFSAALEPYLAAKTSDVRRSLAAQAAFADELGDDPLQDRPPAGLLSALSGHDVLVLFVESYGRSVVEAPDYAGPTLRRLQTVEAELTEAGIGARSGWMSSPVSGGQSWLAHGTLLSGLWVDNQARYAGLIGSRRDSLNQLFRSAGWRTVAAMPAITMPWPEARWFGYDEVLAARELDYRGPPFNWVTMPDQFTLRRIGDVMAASREPVMIEAALISSHAPWTPVPRMVPWEAVGDGRIFDAQARSGETPDVLWRDPAKVRRNYALTIDYALEAVGSFMARFGRGAVAVVLGDHQPAEIVTGPGASRDVPFHILSADPAVLRRVDGWGLSAGMVPEAGGPSFPMSEFRERFVRAMSQRADGAS